VDLEQKGMRHDLGARERVDGHVLLFSPENSVEKKREFRRGEARRTFYSHIKLYTYICTLDYFLKHFNGKHISNYFFTARKKRDYYRSGYDGGI